jgi:ribosomal protein S18 acetylase RimI-like enzyme
MKEYVEKTWGWDERFQEDYFKNHFKPEKTKIIIYDSQDIGILVTEVGDSKLTIVEIQIKPEFQCKGIGTRILKDIIENGRENGFEARLGVLKVNEKARKLYEKLGFDIYEETETHFLMRKL